MDTEGRQFAGSPFNKEDFFHMLVSMGVESSYHEELGPDVSAAARDARQSRRDRIDEEVSGYLDYVEFHNLFDEAGRLRPTDGR